MSNEFQYWFDIENTTDQRVDYFFRLAKATLQEELPDDTRKPLEICIQRLPEAYRLLKETLAPIGVDEPMRLRTIYQMLFAVIVSCGAVGASLSQTSKVKMMHMAPQFEGGARGGRQSGKKRRRDAQKWQVIATPMINNILSANPEMSQDKIVIEVAAGWKHKTPECPGHGTLKPFVAKIKNARKKNDNVLKFK
ncbi:MAG: hypothetical protein WCC90_10265 [Methylocella sp.]